MTTTPMHLSSWKDLAKQPHTLMRVPIQQHTTRDNTQTHSAFNLLKHVGFAVLLLLGEIAFAQPWNPQIIWEREGAGDSSRYGGTIFGLGDQNDDGFDDFAVEAWGWGGPGQVNEAKSEFFHGGNPVSQEPYLVYQGSTESQNLYSGMLPVGDVNNDGFNDWIVARYLEEQDISECTIYLGGTLFPAIYGVLRLPVRQVIVQIGDLNGDLYDDFGFYYYFPNDLLEVYWGGEFFESNVDWSAHGLAFIGGGDVNHDGFDDLLEGLYSATISVFLGGQNPDTIADISVFVPNGTTQPIDLNGDEVVDLVTAGQCNNTCPVEVRFGRESIHQFPDYVLTFGCSVGGADRVSEIGDINADGYNDLGIASEFCDNNPWGIASVWLGYSWLNPNPIYTFQGRSAPWDMIGIREIEGVGDVNGDGIDDFAIGALNGDFDGFRGRAIVIAGNPDLRVQADEVPSTIVEQLSVSVYPNPFNSTTTLILNLPINTRTANLSVTNVLGQIVDLQELNILSPQTEIQLTTNNWPSGIYFAQVQTPTQSQTTKLVLLK